MGFIDGRAAFLMNPFFLVHNNDRNGIEEDEKWKKRNGLGRLNLQR